MDSQSNDIPYISPESQIHLKEAFMKEVLSEIPWLKKTFYKIKEKISGENELISNIEKEVSLHWALQEAVTLKRPDDKVHPIEQKHPLASYIEQFNDDQIKQQNKFLNDYFKQDANCGEVPYFWIITLNEGYQYCGKGEDYYDEVEDYHEFKAHKYLIGKNGVRKTFDKEIDENEFYSLKDHILEVNGLKEKVIEVWPFRYTGDDLKKSIEKKNKENELIIESSGNQQISEIVAIHGGIGAYISKNRYEPPNYYIEMYSLPDISSDEKYKEFLEHLEKSSKPEAILGKSNISHTLISMDSELIR